ncbi:MAG: alpha/beta hydrolase [Myxococcales bacterium]|nr:alpha/beta hydrolase [Myxococcales bacterium]
MKTPDILGHGLTQETLELGSDDEGPVVATLVSRACASGSSRALLYLHGYNDYFFNTELADRVNAEGLDFYALDLRKYGRSLREGQTPGYVEDITTYYEELDAAIDRIRGRDGHRHLTLMGHSTSGLTATLYAADRPGVDALILNSPFFDMAGTWMAEFVAEHLLAAVGKLRPRTLVRKEGPPYYAWSLHRDFGRGGEWSYNLEWKRERSMPSYAGWMRAVVKGQERVQHGLELSCPSLVMYSSASSTLDAWDEQRAFTSDIILDVADMDRYADGLRPRPTELRVAGGMHDLLLSRPDVRAEVYRQLLAWLAEA